MGMKIWWIDMVKDASKNFQEVHYCSAMPGLTASQCLHFARHTFLRNEATDANYKCN
jgi:hypothetical protein